MNRPISSPRWLCLLVLLVAGLASSFAGEEGASAKAPEQASAGTTAKIVSASPMSIAAEGKSVSGQLPVAPELLTEGRAQDLIFTITVEPNGGRVGLAGDGDEDFFGNKTSRFSYFAYQPADGYAGEDSFTYTVRNTNSGLVFENRVLIQVSLPPPVVMDKYVVTETHERDVKAVPVSLTTRPNTPVARKLPSHEDFMSAADRQSIVNPKVIYVLDPKAAPKHGSVQLNRATGQLSYAPDPGYIGDERIGYYTTDENNPQLGVENIVTIAIEPIRIPKHMAVDRAKSREVDLVFVINNSPSMAPHQQRIADNLRRFRRLFDERGLDYRIGVLTTDFVNEGERAYKVVDSVQFSAAGQPVLDRKQQPKHASKKVASNGTLVSLPVMSQPWVTPQTSDAVFAELVKVGTNGTSNRTAFTAVYNFVAGYQSGQNALLRPGATTIVVFFMDEEETRMATWKDLGGGKREAEWVENGQLPQLIEEFNARHPAARQTLDSYINFWVLRPFIIVKGNQRGKIEMNAVVSPNNVSHRRAAELTGGTVLNIESDFSAPLAEMGDRIADTVAVALDPVDPGATLYRKSLRVLVDGEPVMQDPLNGFVYDELSHSIRFRGAAKKKAFAAKIDISYEEHR